MDKLVELINPNIPRIPERTVVKLLDYADSPYYRGDTPDDKVLVRWYVGIFYKDQESYFEGWKVIGICDNGKALPFFNSYMEISTARTVARSQALSCTFLQRSALIEDWATYDIVPLRKHPSTSAIFLKLCVL